ncbi:MAG: helix-turn-helix domain-containing protein [Chitinivibrionales bacterium]|nr:helix-turn-helix domain-containing protein [Chitinivibrionales bacterium]
MGDLSPSMDHAANPVFSTLPVDTPIELSLVTHTKVTETLRDMHYELELGFVVRGCMERRLPEWEARLVTGDFWLCGAWEPHAYRVVEAPCAVGVFVVSPAYLARLSFDRKPSYDWLRPFTAPPRDRPSCSPTLRPAVGAIARTLQECDGYEQSERHAWLQVLFQQLLLTIRREWRPPAIPAQRTVADPFARIAPGLRLAFEKRAHVPVVEAARACGMSRNTFERVFTQTMGIGFARFALRRRLRAAARALLETDMPIKTIAYEWGFTDPSHLQHTFVQHYGCTPGEYRRTAHTKELPR